MQLARDVILVRWAEKEQMEDKKQRIRHNATWRFFVRTLHIHLCHLVLSFGYIWALPEMYRKSWVERVEVCRYSGVARTIPKLRLSPLRSQPSSKILYPPPPVTL